MTLNDHTKIHVTPDSSIRDAIETIEIGSFQIALVVGNNGLLQGTVTDGDIRRGLLKGLGLNDPVVQRQRLTDQEELRKRYQGEELDRIDEDYITALEHGDFVVAALHDHDVLHGVGHGQRLVHVGLQRNDGTASP